MYFHSIASDIFPDAFNVFGLYHLLSIVSPFTAPVTLICSPSTTMPVANTILGLRYLYPGKISQLHVNHACYHHRWIILIAHPYYHTATLESNFFPHWRLSRLQNSPYPFISPSTCQCWPSYFLKFSYCHTSLQFVNISFSKHHQLPSLSNVFHEPCSSWKHLWSHTNPRFPSFIIFHLHADRTVLLCFLTINVSSEAPIELGSHLGPSVPSQINILPRFSHWYTLYSCAPSMTVNDTMSVKWHKCLFSHHCQNTCHVSIAIAITNVYIVTHLLYHHCTITTPNVLPF